MFRSSYPLVFGHRGGAALAPENTLAAFERGLASGADGIECDVRLSRDGVPVVIHDATLDRTTDARGPVAACSARELARVDAGYRFAPGRFPARGQGYGVPTLREVLDRFPEARVIIEMKVASDHLALAVADAINGADAVARVCVGSFHQRALDVLRREEPAIPTSGSVGETRWTLYRSWIGWPRPSTRPHVAFQVPERAGAHRVVSPRFVRQAHDEGRAVQVWVVDREEDCRRLLAWGVDGLISDRPDVAVSVRNQLVQGGRGGRAIRGGGGR